jgi:hypothetical protein
MPRTQKPNTTTKLVERLAFNLHTYLNYEVLSAQIATIGAHLKDSKESYKESILRDVSLLINDDPECWLQNSATQHANLGEYEIELKLKEQFLHT